MSSLALASSGSSASSFPGVLRDVLGRLLHEFRISLGILLGEFRESRPHRVAHFTQFFGTDAHLARHRFHFVRAASFPVGAAAEVTGPGGLAAGLVHGGSRRVDGVDGSSVNPMPGCPRARVDVP